MDDTRYYVHYQHNDKWHMLINLYRDGGSLWSEEENNSWLGVQLHTPRLYKSRSAANRVAKLYEAEVGVWESVSK